MTAPAPRSRSSSALASDVPTSQGYERRQAPMWSRRSFASGDPARFAVRRFYRVPGGGPGLHAALDVVSLVTASLEHHRGQLATVAASADDRDRSRLVQLRARAGHDRVERQEDRSLDPSGLPLVGLPAVDQLDLVQPIVDAFDGGQLSRGHARIVSTGTGTAVRRNRRHGRSVDPEPASSARENDWKMASSNRTN